MSKELKIHNSLSQKKEKFVPIHPNQVGMYVCGMTVYDYCHIGHARILVVFDVIARHLRALGYHLTYVRNITDIDDKIIQRAFERNQNFAELTEFFIEKMHEDERNLGNIPPDHQPKATDHIPEIITMIEKLIANDLAYVASNQTVYYQTRHFKEYGKLSAKKLDELKQGARIEVDEAKRDALDFVLWKPAKKDEPSWDSPWGSGRPGWHIECSAMSCNHLGDYFDLHGGGVDLKFPHHENEIAQSKGATGAKFVKGWIHVGFVNVNDEKMSKSLGNFFTIREVFEHYSPEVVRYFLISTHYRKPLNYSEENLKLATSALDRLYGALRNESEQLEMNLDSDEIVSDFESQFNAQMNDDFNTPGALAVLFELVKEINKSKNQNESNQVHKLQNTLAYLGSRLGILSQNANDYFKQDAKMDSKTIESLIVKRNQARAQKDFALADKIRDDLKAKGVILEDASGQTSWKILSK